MADSLQTPDVVPFPEGSRPKLLDQVRHIIRMRHYSRRTETTYVHWIRRFIVFHHKQHPSTMGAPEITAFLSWLATGQRVSASTQNQALNAVLFLYRHVLHIEVGAIEQVPRAKMPHRVPGVLSREEVGKILKNIQGTMWMVVALLYGSGLRLQECLELRVKDLDFDRHEIVVRRGKGQKDRRTMLPVAIEERLQGHLREVRRQHERDLADGVGRVVLPFALDRKYPNAATDWAWDRAVIKVEAENVGGGRWALWVRNPTVMAHTVQLQVFQRSFSTKGEGRGLGTYSIKLLTERFLKGKASFTSKEGTGTEFRITIPSSILTPGGASTRPSRA